MVSRRANDIDSKYRLLEILNNEGSLEFTRNYLRTLYAEMLEAINEIGGRNPLWEETVDGALRELLSREVPTK